MKDYGPNPGMFRKWLRNYKVSRHRPKIWRLPEPDIAYIKVTKVASTSIELTLSRHLHATLGTGDVDEVTPKLVRQYADQYAQHLKVKDFMASNKPPFTFAFVRNPLDRLVSSYTDKILDVRNAGKSKNIFWNLDINLDMSFEDFVERVAEIPDEKIDRHLRAQSYFLCNNGQVIPDFIGRFEKMSEDWSELAARFGLPELPHKNKSTKSKSKTIYTLKSAQMAAERYQEDIENFGYGDDVEALIASLK
ncbi:sulfotransferase family protein [Oceanicoccus sagamiensis]|uniref:Sulfotransferase family protein n=1 Tax=Oceanicoccus sagamiensis TaxID=716816 RepID=A0A1X9NIS8_9GAMM|nr:sulfotransferase family protein [Oceanicoccus sagamiensis]ARN73893.1 hypothetical protein BST96_07055 [Oceanicoccus sagamiensis]